MTRIQEFEFDTLITVNGVEYNIENVPAIYSVDVIKESLRSMMKLEAENQRLMDAIDLDEKNFQRLEKQLEKCKEQRDWFVECSEGNRLKKITELNKELEEIK